MLELNPIASIAWKDFIAFGAGFRAIYTFGQFNNTLYVPFNININMGSLIGSINSFGTTKVDQISGVSAWSFGYNLATTIKPFAFLIWVNLLLILRI